MFYLVGLFNGLILEALHEVSHVMTPNTHNHSFLSDHEAIDYSSLEAMAGHSHEELEILKDLLQVNQQDKGEPKVETSFKLDKHIVKETNVKFKINTSEDGNIHKIYQDVTPFWCPNVSTPPPQNC